MGLLLLTKGEPLGSYWLFLGLCGQPQNHRWGLPWPGQARKNEKIFPMTESRHPSSRWASVLPSISMLTSDEVGKPLQVYFLIFKMGIIVRTIAYVLGLLIMCQVKMEHLLVSAHVISYDAHCDGGCGGRRCSYRRGGRSETRAGPFLHSALSLSKQTGRSS